MNRIFVKKENLEERKKQYEECLRFLYYIEDIFNYDYEIISKCIDELQNNLEIKEDKNWLYVKGDVKSEYNLLYNFYRK